MKDRKRVPTRRGIGANVTRSQAPSAKTSAPAAFAVRTHHIGSSASITSIAERSANIYIKNMDYVFYYPFKRLTGEDREKYHPTPDFGRCFCHVVIFIVLDGMT
jgi:hypothetical protein